MKILKTIKWLLNSPPTNITNKVPKGTKCDYCGKEERLENMEGVFCICSYCRKKAFDKILKKGDKK